MGMETEQKNENPSLDSKKKLSISTGSAIIVAGFLIAIAIFASNFKNSENQADQNDNQPITSKDVTITPQDHLVGDVNASIVLIEYSDIDCPFCRALHPTLEKIVGEYNGSVAWVYRDFPLTGLHPQAYNKALASECIAQNEGEEAYFTYLGYLFANTVDEKELSATASKLGFNKTNFEKCFEGKEAVNEVESDIKTGNDYGIKGTPYTILVNQKTKEVSQIRGAVPYEDLKKIIDAELAK